jgi:hypothetical protein
MTRKECEMNDIELELYVGKMKFNTKMKCFDGWNKIGIM